MKSYFPLYFVVDLESKMDDSNKQASVAKQPTDMYVVGRCIINLWKLVRHEVSFITSIMCCDTPLLCY